MARTALNVIQFTKYNQAIYPFDYYVECLSTDTGAISVLASGADEATEINYNDDALIGSDGEALYAEAPTGKYVLKVEGFLKAPDATTKQFEFSMNKPDEDYLLVVANTATVATYYVECLSTDTGAKKVVAENATTNQINYNDASLVDAYGTALYTDAPTGDKYVLAVSGDKQITILKGNSIQGILDQTYDLRHGGTYYIRLESGRFKNTYGDDKGKVVLETTDTLVKAAVLCFK